MTKVKIYLLLFCLLFGTSLTSAQLKRELKIEDDGFRWYSIDGGECAEDLSGRILVPKKDGNYITYKTEGKYFQVYNFKKSGDSTFGIYSVKGKCIVPNSMGCTYGSLERKDGISYLRLVFGENYIDDQGVYDMDLNVVIPPIYEGCYLEKAGDKYYFKVKKYDLYWGAIDLNGKTIVKVNSLSDYNLPLYSDISWENGRFKCKNVALGDRFIYIDYDLPSIKNCRFNFKEK